MSSFNERQLRARGAIEPEGDVIGLMRWGYPGAFIAMGIEGALSGPAPPNVLMGGLALFGVAKALKVWAISSLGSRWTYRVLVAARRAAHHVRPVPVHPASQLPRGGRRDCSASPMIVWAPITGVLATIGFGWLMILRMKVEDRALGRGAK